jgi:hypothetical protein
MGKRASYGTKETSKTLLHLPGSFPRIPEKNGSWQPSRNHGKQHFHRPKDSSSQQKKYHRNPVLFDQ